MKLALQAGLLAAGLAAAAGAWLWLAPGAKVESGAASAALAASGTLNAVTTVQVGSQIAGQIREIHVDFNSPVKQGQVIARIDPATFELRVNQARADLQAAREQLSAVQAQVRIGKAQVRNALAAVRQGESLLRQAEADLERTIIRAPVDGTVILRNVDAGQTVAAGGTPVLFTIARDLHDMQVEVAIDAADVGRLRPGQPATLTVDAFPGRSFSGSIVQIRKSGAAAHNVGYTVVISARNPDLSLLPGMTAHVRIPLDERAGVE